MREGNMSYFDEKYLDINSIYVKIINCYLIINNLNVHKLKKYD